MSSKMPQRRRLSDLFQPATSNTLAQQFDEVAAASDAVVIPTGIYRCRASSGELHQSRSGTAGFRVVFVIEEGEYRGNRLYLDCWLTEKAMPLAKRDLMKLGISNFRQLEEPFPQGLVADVSAVSYVGEDSIERTRVRSFVIVDRKIDPTADEDFPSSLPVV